MLFLTAVSLGTSRKLASACQLVFITSAGSNQCAVSGLRTCVFGISVPERGSVSGSAMELDSSFTLQIFKVS